MRAMVLSWNSLLLAVAVLWCLTSLADQARPFHERCRRCLVSPDVNPPDPFPGYGGFNGWEDVIRLSGGDLLVGFEAGYWHISPPTPYVIPKEKLDAWHRSGFPKKHEAPTGGRIMAIRSSDGGITWTKPETIIDTRWDDQEPSFLELPDGTLVMSFTTLADWRDLPETPPGKRPLSQQVAVIRSADGGKTWPCEDEVVYLGSPLNFRHLASSPAVRLEDGTLLLATFGCDHGGPWKGPIYASRDEGRTWELRSIIDHIVVDEPALGTLPDGRVLLVSRNQPVEKLENSPVIFSDDGGKTWSEPVWTGVAMAAPHMVVQRDGTVVIVYGPGGGGGARAIFSTDGGDSWLKQTEDQGFLLDPSVYGYPGACELEDGSIYCVYYDGWNRQTATGVWAIRFRVNDNRDGIELLPVPGATGEPPPHTPAEKKEAPHRDQIDVGAMDKDD